VHVSGTGVIAKPLPQLQHLLFGSIGQPFQGGEFFQKPKVIGRALLNTGLLQYHLRNPDFVGVAGLAPRQRPFVLFVPSDQSLSNVHAGKSTRNGQPTGLDGLLVMASLRAKKHQNVMMHGWIISPE